MSDIRARLADVLKDATEEHGGCSCLMCAWESAGALLSLRGIAIVDLQMLSEIVVMARMFPAKTADDIIRPLLAAAAQAQGDVGGG